ncbi:hypothetical protein [Paenibacillus solani]|uniref:Uncharacterized protein n=1 Tax=Paenibacillus solani TaxID=1705565 RepID=A0A0M1P3S2_9BACL|nr:hypothetical protein [Paenibacillus solani]KOR89133.1 hypothetical protein AM231_08135 [Paenibacillus solani]
MPYGQPGQVTQLLQKLKESYPERLLEVQNLFKESGIMDMDYPVAHQQKSIEWSREMDAAVPLLDGGSMELTPMLQERYSYADSIQDLTWYFPSLSEISDMVDEEDVIDAYEAHREDWEDSAPATFPLSRLYNRY